MYVRRQASDTCAPFPGVALSLNNNEVNIYARAGSEWRLQETLQGHDLRVTGIDWAPNTNRIVTCGAVSSFHLLLFIHLLIHLYFLYICFMFVCIPC